MDLNFEHLHLFIEGMKQSREQHAEENKSYEYGLNGRLYSHNGKLAFSSIKGTLAIYNNPNIVKYLGFYSFMDELVLFVKYDSDTKNISQETQNSIQAVNVDLEIPFGSSQFVFVDELTALATENINTIITNNPPKEENPLIDTYNEVPIITEIDFSDYYDLSGTDVPNHEICPMSALVATEYNNDYDDAVIVLKTSGYHSFTDRLAWLGKMNWDINRKITTVGIDENMYYKRVYFTDNLNPLRVLNLRDNSLSYRTAEEFDIKQNSIMLQPLIKEIKEGGSIKAMSVQYAYKLISENGQVTKFSPYSELIPILRDSDDFDFEGGNVEESTSKQVVIQCPVLNENYKEIQAIAIEYEANTIPTAIRNLGIKPIAQIVEFTHTGNEAEFDSNFTLEDITETGNIWTYCNDITTKNNKLIAAGLRNDPYALQEKYVEDLFLFKGWDWDQNTHDILINPDPKDYRYIDPTNEEKAIYLKKQLYKRFLFFGNVTVTLKNKENPNADKSISFESSSDQYIDYIDDIWNWLEQLQAEGIIGTDYPNLDISRSNTSILFAPIDDLIITDFFDYYFETSISQSIIDFDNEYGFLPTTVNQNSLIYGAQSAGFNIGTGVRISFKEVKEAILNKSPEYYESGPILDLETPTLNKTFVKGEIYRMSIQFFKSGNPLFAIVLGDVYTPNNLDGQKYLDESGNVVIEDSSIRYVNQSVEGNQLMAHRLEMQVEVRIPCLFKSAVDSYQIQYVERTENNRTILCQGLAAPLTRLIDWENDSQSGVNYAPNVFSKWTLPFNGGPLYTVGLGFYAYDNITKGENFNDLPDGTDRDSKDEALLRDNTRNREITNRKMFYFDSPDLIHGRISDKNIANGTVHVIARVNTDATGELIRSKAKNEQSYHPDDGLYESLGGENEVYQDLAFSKKLGYSKISGPDDLKPWVLNISIFSEYTIRNQEELIETVSELLNKGEIIPSAVLGTSFEAVNMALSMHHQSCYNDGHWRSGNRTKPDFESGGRYGSECAESAQESHGYPTVFIRTKEDIFTDAFIGPQASDPIKSEAKQFHATKWLVDKNGNEVTYLESSDSHAIINIKIDNEDAIYGGRNKYAYSQNRFIPLGKIIPIKGSEADTQSQIFRVQGDFYVSLFLRTKNDYSDTLEQPEGIIEMRHHHSNYKNSDERDFVEDWNRGAGWAYGVILETEVESRLTSEYRFYKAADSVDFYAPISEFINSAYFKKNNLRLYSAVPYNFKDDPLMVNVLSASKTKLSGDYFDAWTEFLLNEFYELEKNKGIITNITSWKDSIFAIQELESSEVFIDESDFITTQAGESVAVKKGDGTTFTNHKKISDFGTSIRRALAEGELGFSFFDERNRAFVKFGQSLSLQLELQLKLHELFQFDKVIDTEGYYDPKYKETNIRIRTESGMAYLLSYNEVEKKFNGWYAYNHDIYITHDKRVFIPCCALTNVTIYCPVIFSEKTIIAQVGQYFEYQIEAHENPIWFNATNLPLGVEVNQNTGLIYGVIDTPGTYVVRATAENEECSDTLEITIYALPAELFGVANGKATVTAFLQGFALIEGVSNGVANVTGTLNAGPTAIEGNADGVATVTGIMFAIGSLSGVINGVAVVTAPWLESIAVLSGGSSGIATVVGVLTLRAGMEVPINGIATVVGTVLQPFWMNDYMESISITSDCNIIVHGGMANYGTDDDRDDSHATIVYDKCGNINEAFMVNYEPGLPNNIGWSEEGYFVDHEGNLWLCGDLYGSFNQGWLRKYLPDGTQDLTFPETHFNSQAGKPYVDLDGNIYIAGLFGSLDNALGTWNRDKVVKILPTGIVDPLFNAGSTGNNSHSSIRPAGNGKMWVHGYFLKWGGISCGHIVLIDAITGARDFSFDPGVGPDEAGMPGTEPLRMAMIGENAVFTSYWGVNNYDGNVTPRNVFKVNRDGSLNTAFNLNCGTGFEGGPNDPFYGSGRNGCVTDIILTSEGKFLISTLAATFDGTPIGNVVRLNADGTLDNTFAFALTEMHWIWRLTEGGDYYYSTMVRQVDWFGTWKEYPIKISKDGSSVEIMMNLSACNAEPNPCLDIVETEIYGVATVEGDLNQPNYFDSYMVDAKITPDCNLAFYGNFDNYGNDIDGMTPTRAIAILDPCGNLIEPFTTNFGTGLDDDQSYTSQGIAFGADGSMYVGGWFTTVNGQSSPYFVKLKPDGTIDTSFVIGTGFNNFTNIPLVDTDGWVYIIGIFGTYKGNSHPRLIKLDQTGTPDPNFTVGSGFETTTQGIRDAGRGQIWIHGYFATYKGIQANKIVLLNKADASRDMSFDTGSGPNNATNTKPMDMAIDGEGIIMTSRYDVNLYNGDSVANNIFKLDRTGKLDTVFNANAGTGFNNSVYDVFNDNGKFLIGGSFTTYNGNPVPPIIRLNNDGTIDNTFNYNLDLWPYAGSAVKLGDFYYYPVYIGPTYEVVIVKIAMDGTAIRQMNLDGCSEWNADCLDRMTDTIYGWATTSGTLIAKGELIGQSDGVGTTSGDLTTAASQIQGHSTPLLDNWAENLGNDSLRMYYTTNARYLQIFNTHVGNLYDIEFELELRGGSPDCPIQCHVFLLDTQTGLPTGSPLEIANETYQAKDLISELIWYRFTFSGIYYNVPIAIGIVIPFEVSSSFSNSIGVGSSDWPAYFPNVDYGQVAGATNVEPWSLKDYQLSHRINYNYLDLGVLNAPIILANSIIYGSTNPVIYDAVTLEQIDISNELPGYVGAADIAHTENRFFNVIQQSQSRIDIWNIISNDPFSTTKMASKYMNFYASPLLFAIDDLTLIVASRVGNNAWNIPDEIYTMDLTSGAEFPPLTHLFQLPHDTEVENSRYVVSGDCILTNEANPKLIITILEMDEDVEYIFQYDWATLTLTQKIRLPDTIFRGYGLAIQNNEFYIFNASTNSTVFHINKSYPFEVALTDTIVSQWISGASQRRASCNISFSETMYQTIQGQATVTGDLTTIPGQMTSHEINDGILKTDGPSTSSWNFNTTSYVEMCVTFKPNNEQIHYVEFFIRHLNGTTDMDVRAAIYAVDVDGKPTTLLETSPTIHAASLMTDDTWYRWNFKGEYYGQNIAIVWYYENVVLLQYFGLHRCYNNYPTPANPTAFYGYKNSSGVWTVSTTTTLYAFRIKVSGVTGTLTPA